MFCYQEVTNSQRVEVAKKVIDTSNAFRIFQDHVSKGKAIAPGRFDMLFMGPQRSPLDGPTGRWFLFVIPSGELT